LRLEQPVSLLSPQQARTGRAPVAWLAIDFGVGRQRKDKNLRAP
jgi:hypothetical protein